MDKEIEDKSSTVNSTASMGGILVNNLDPARMLQARSSDDLELIVEDWQRAYLGKKYIRVERIAGTGDKGRDVLCTIDKDGSWDNYQCKKYKDKLSPVDALIEIGKCCYYCFLQEYQPPQKYYFVSPMGVGVKLRDLLSNGDKIKSELISKWSVQCRNKIIESKSIDLSGPFLEYIEKFDFSIFRYVSQTEFIESFKQTPYYTKWFGVLKKPRKLIHESDIPAEIQKMELVYVKKLLEAYSDHLGKNIDAKEKLKDIPELENNFKRQRLYFYSAEYLDAYSRETYPPDEHFFQRLKEEVFHSIIDDIERDVKDGFERLRIILRRAADLTIRNNPLSSDAGSKEMMGVCRHLANEKEEVKWVKKR